MSNMNTNLERIFDIEPVEYSGDYPSTITAIPHTQQIVLGESDKPIDENLDYDYKETRNNLYKLLDQGKDALTTALEIAKQSENPRAFEVVGNLMKQLSDINHQLVDLHSKRRQTTAINKTKETTITNNSIFLGTTASLSQMLSNFKKG
jgi:hypothetical protein